MSQTFAGHFRRGEGGGGRLMIAEIITETASMLLHAPVFPCCLQFTATQH